MLVEATDDHFAALIAGAARPGLQVPDGGVEALDVLRMLQGLARSVRQEIAPASWLIVADGEIVGLCSITKAFPTPGTVEIGYGLSPSCWIGRDPKSASPRLPPIPPWTTCRRSAFLRETASFAWADGSTPKTGH